MLTLRKRIKLSSSCLNVQEIEQDKKEDFKSIKRLRLDIHYSPNVNKLENLPIELIFCIFENLNLKDWLNLRLVNSYFKYLIDYCSIIWKFISLRLTITNFNNDLSSFVDFFQTKPRLDLIRIEYPQIIKKDFYKECIKIENKKKTISKKYCLLINQINVLSMNILNYFCCDCSHMIIESFVMDNSSEIKDKNFHYYTSKLVNKFFNLESFDLMCLLFDSYIKSKHKLKIWTNVFKENMLLNKMSLILMNLQQFSLHYYMDSSKLLIESLIQMKNLKSIHIIKSCPKDDLNEVDYNQEDKLDIESVAFKFTSISMVHLILKNLVKLNTIKNLEMYVKEFFINQSNKDDDDDDDNDLYLHDIFSIYLIKLVNLDLFSTNLLHSNEGIQMKTNSINFNQNKNSLHFRQIHISNDPMTRSIKSIDALLYKRRSYKFDLNDYQKFLSKFKFINLNKIEIKIRLNCLNLVNGYNQINQLVTIILNEKISSLKQIIVNFKCENCWKNANNNNNNDDDDDNNSFS